MNNIVTVNNISKKFNIGKAQPYMTLRDSIVDWVKLPVRKLKHRKNNNVISNSEFWALKNVSFTVKQGEVLGIIGKNGAGKSTLLKILSQITPPTNGKIILEGRVGSLLEVGTGFHPELTGRENIYLNGAILGMKQKEIKNKFDAIVSFAEIEKFLNTPVKFYSSGMYTRLAFSVAAHLEPEILVIDEVLAVGDTQFQKKCLGKMEEISKRRGRTVLFVSHNMGAIYKLCKKTLLLDQGKIVEYGETNKVVNKYLEIGLDNKLDYIQPANKKKKMNLRKVSLATHKDKETNNITYEEDVVIRVEYEINERVPHGIVWMHLLAVDGTVAFCTADYDLHPELRETRNPGYYVTDMKMPGKWLSPGSYIVNIGINSYSPTEVFDRVDTIKFNIIDNGSSPKSKLDESSRSGIFQPFLNWTTVKIK